MRERLSLVHTIEFFHLGFLQVLQARVDQHYYVLKGGANLRYFFNSPRYSEDIDFDGSGKISRWKLEGKVDEVLTSRPLTLILQTRGVTIGRVAKPKQTETTQRWKITLRVENLTEPIPTKIEFSRRGMDERNQLDQVPPRVVQQHALRAPTVRRYLADAMAEQKISALVKRTDTQVRDIFDLDLLFRQFPNAVRPRVIAPERLQAAIDRVLEVTYEAYQSLVVRFLDPDVVELYERPDIWDQTQRHVIDRLNSLR